MNALAQFREKCHSEPPELEITVSSCRIFPGFRSSLPRDSVVDVQGNKYCSQGVVPGEMFLHAECFPVCDGEPLNPIKRYSGRELRFFDRSQGKTTEMGLCLATIKGGQSNCSELSGIVLIFSSASSKQPLTVAFHRRRLSI